MAKFNQYMLPLAVAFTTALYGQGASAVSGEDFEYHGYFRTGTGGSSEGGDQVCFQLPGVGWKYRLGNECNSYIELVFNANLFKGEDGAYFRMQHTIAYEVEGDTEFEESKFVAIRESWLEAGNVFGGFFEGSKIWAGKRFYRRHDVHINDFYFWDNNGVGAGVEDVDLGFGKLAFAYLRDTIKDDPSTPDVIEETFDGLAIPRYDLRVYDIEVNPGGLLTVGLTYKGVDDADDAEIEGDQDGFELHFIHFQDGVLGGFNKATLQLGWGSAAGGPGIDLTPLGHGNADLAADSDDQAFRLVEQLLFEPNNNFSGLLEVTYEDRKDISNWWSLGIRPKFYITDYLNVAVELGYDRFDPDGGDARHLTKFTVAPQISAGRGFWVRPLLRAFVTYANWNDAARDAGLAGGVDGVFGNDTDGWSYGVQAEAWW